MNYKKYRRNPAILAFISALKWLHKMAEQLGINFAYVVDAGPDYEIDSTGDGAFTEHAADQLTLFAMNKIDEEDERLMNEIEDCF